MENNRAGRKFKECEGKMQSWYVDGPGLTEKVTFDKKA